GPELFLEEQLVGGLAEQQFVAGAVVAVVGGDVGGAFERLFGGHVDRAAHPGGVADLFEEGEGDPVVGWEVLAGGFEHEPAPLPHPGGEELCGGSAVMGPHVLGNVMVSWIGVSGLLLTTQLPLRLEARPRKARLCTAR